LDLMKSILSELTEKVLGDFLMIIQQKGQIFEELNKVVGQDLIDE